MAPMRFAFFLLLLAGASRSGAQNLLMNGGFEEENICTEYIKNCAPEAWISTSLISNYYFDDVKNAYEGQHFVGLLFRTSVSRPRQYLRSRLLCGLRKDAEYQVEFYARSSHPGLDSIGVSFSAADILYEKDRMRDYNPVRLAAGQLDASMQGKWQKIAFRFTAGGDEQFLVIGDFRKTAHNLNGQPDIMEGFYYFIDKVSLKPVNADEKLCSEAALVKEEEYNMDFRHNALEKQIYRLRKSPPPVVPLAKTVVLKVDTLIIPDVLFAVNSYALSREANELLDSLVKAAASMQVDSLVVEGHTDSTGSAALNEKLSRDRAATVASYLQPGFNRPVRSFGLASQRPVASNRNAEGRRRNRRVEIFIFRRE
ncbi:MAG TPA: OmpA family protein [Flavisolibacter sp.]|nr:OmpA family protein [Flavisolibacter sp.]